MTEHYRGYRIDYDPPPIPTTACDWSWEHEDFDGAEDAGDRRCGHSPSLEQAKLDIDDQIADAEPPLEQPAIVPIGSAVLFTGRVALPRFRVWFELEKRVPLQGLPGEPFPAIIERLADATAEYMDLVRQEALRK